MIPLVWHLLQSTLFAVAAGLLNLALRHDRASVRHALWTAASVKFLIPLAVLAWLIVQIPRPAEPVHARAEMTFEMADPGQPSVPVSAPLPSRRIAWLPIALGVLWLCGSVTLLVRWGWRWRRMAAVVRRARCGSPPLLVSDDISEPAVFGIFRPVILLPAGIQESLPPEQWEAVLAHELCHLRRRDNLAAAIHMLVECLFWFHPLVWWIGARLVEERERACDEAVLASGANREAYADSILKVCEWALNAALPCVSGITGGDLSARIESIMTARIAPSLRPGKRALLGAFAAAALATPLILGVLRPPRLPAQAETTAPMHFDVASVKAVEQTWLGIFPIRSGGRITWNTDLTRLVGYAYRLESWRISGPLPGTDHLYAIDATTVPTATEDQVRLMFQSLLAERFHMEAHRVTKEVEGYALTVAKSGSRMHEDATDLPEWFRKRGASAAQMEGMIVTTAEAPGVGAITARGVTMRQLASGLQNLVRTAVLDRTGLTGKYYFAFEYALENHPDEVTLPDLATAVQQQLGLKLETHKGPVEMLVVDRIDKTPTEN